MKSRAAAPGVLRAADAADLPAILAIERVTDTAPHWPEAVYQGLLSAAVAEESAGPRRALWVACREGCVCGFAAASVVAAEPDPAAELETVVVAADARRLGIGAELCREVIRWSQAAGARRIELEVRAGSVGAQALYIGLGFVPAGRRRSYYRDPEEDALLFDLPLA